ncbi:MAG: MBL fold metallo-hydrolase [bacterium]|nr:MBL fold metallo-hydrolase [bacterium]
MSSAKLIYLGGGSVSENGIGPSASVLEIGNTRIGVDYGLEFLPGKKYGYPDDKILKGEKLDYLLLTHAHTDHIGSIPVGWKNGAFKDDLKVLATPQTKAALWPSLLETWKRVPACGGDFSTILKTDNQCQTIPLGEVELADGIKAFFGPAGHVPGAFYVIIRVNGLNILFMGDVCWHHQEVVAGSDIPDDIPDAWLPDVIAITDLTSVMEMTSDYELEESRMVEYIQKSLTEGKKIIVPAFAIARGQNVSLRLKKAGIKEVYIDGSIKNFMEIFAKHRWSSKDREVSPTGANFIRGHQEREALLAQNSPLVVVTTAGMGDGGPVRYWLEQGLEREDFVFVGVGFATPESTLGKLYEIGEARKKDPAKKAHIKLEDERTGLKQRYQVVADLAKFRLSGHGGLGNLTQMCEKIIHRRGGRKMLTIGLTHGSRRSKHKAASILSEYAETVYYGDPGMIFSLS